MLEDRPARPLDERELRMLAEISSATRRDDPALAHWLSGLEGEPHPPVRRTGTALSLPLVCVVMAAAALLALLIVSLPTGLAVAVVICVLLFGVPVGCIVWARRRGEL
ncbi:DUF3040 domain-containing protein [Pseudonocardia sp. C8]|uniref:DUF3040 domain-containing protein n=1 Tax=Pseudonocardia sp. C8 TaxID=2762759 RepID=UPI00164314BF|nr:DUF3040 domain-containing protein [Pseudonocardia sp. C8]